ncbi:MAG TPA: DUF4861 family protein [Bacteroidales bacterium]|nr:DUF4861 family protein [Bacteroidales bacterium]
MTYIKMFLLAGLISTMVSAQGQGERKNAPQIPADVMIEALQPKAYCTFVPERADDFAVENNYIAMRFYGPALRDNVEDAGCDCWIKNVEYPIIEKWYKLSFEGYSYHEDRGEGWDPYKVGSSAGMGGTALWIDGDREGLNCFTEWEIMENGPDRCSFILTYEAEINGSTYKEEKHITLEMDQRLYTAESTFWKDGKIAKDLPVCVGLATHDGNAISTADPASGWISCWETMADDNGLGTAAAMDPAQIKSVEYIPGKSVTGEDYSGHILLVAETNEQGKINYAAGYGSEAAGDIISQEIWTAYLKEYCKETFK